MAFQPERLADMNLSDTQPEQMQLFDRVPITSPNPPVVETISRAGKIPAPLRRLKIEDEGDFWQKTTKPKIRLKGRWLEQAGFKPGHRVTVKCVALGVIELTSDTSRPPEITANT